MDKQFSARKSEPQRTSSYHQHQRQRFWQVIFPVAAAGLIVLAASIFIFLSITGLETGVEVSQWADASLIWLILPLMLLAVIITLVLGGLIYGVAHILSILPEYTFLVQQYVNLFSEKIKYWTKKMTAPIINIRSFNARVDAFFSNVFTRIDK